MRSLLSICMEYILSRPNLFCNEFALLPPHIKNRILKRITTIQIPSNVKFIFRSLVHSHLKEIDFSLYEVDDELLRIISPCHLLYKLILSRNVKTTVTEPVLMEVMPNFKKLCIFHAPKCLAINDNFVKLLVENSPNITELDISGCAKITDAALGELGNLKRLTALNISRTNVTIDGIKLYLNGYGKSSLKELRMAECPSVTAEAINIICEQCEALEVFVFYNTLSKNGNHRIIFYKHKNMNVKRVNFENANFKKMKQLTWSVFW